MLLSPKQRLVELIRLLEARGFVFKNDPAPITQSLKASTQSLIEKLESRATRIDAGQELAHSIQTVDSRLNLTILGIGVLWCVLGFLGLFGLMRSETVNFFYVLVCLLGVNTLMFSLWLLLLLKKDSPTAKLFNPSVLVRAKDPVTQATVSLYSQQLKARGMRWYLGKITHGLWLATLTGMLFAIVFLLIVRQYSFSWQSTLLTSEQLVWLVDVLKWLPEKVGFGTPSQADVIASQKMVSAEFDGALARKWAGLLIGSMLCYGIVPRFLAWAGCRFMLARQKLSLPLDNPYYQNLMAQWATEVVDANDMPIEVVKKAPTPKVSRAPKLAVLFETPWDNVAWASGTLDTDWDYFAKPAQVGLESEAEAQGESAPPQQSASCKNVIDTRNDFEALEAHLQNTDVQLLVGIRAEALPDRGVLRKLDKLAKLAKGGLVVKLLVGADTQLNELDARHSQWHAALAERGIGLIDYQNAARKMDAAAH